MYPPRQQVVPDEDKDNDKEERHRPYELAATHAGSLGVGCVLREGSIELGDVVGLVDRLALLAAHLVHQLLQLLLALIAIDDAGTVLSGLSGFEQTHIGWF